MPCGLEEWANNFFQWNYRWITQESLAKIKRPLFELGIHVTFKTAETAAVIGGLILHPIYRFYLNRALLEENRTNNSSKIIRIACRRLQARVLLAGLALGPVLTVGYTKALGLTDEQLRERCYRLRFNRSQLQTDRCALALGFVGWYYTRWAGCVDGINIALAFTGAHHLISKYIGSYPLYVDKIENPPADRDMLRELPVGANIVVAETPEWWESKSIAPPRPEGVRVKSNVKLW